MSRTLKRVLIAVGILLAIGFIVPFFIDVDRYRPQIIAQVESQTGRKVEIGHISARLIPTPGFSVENVTLGPPAGFAPVNLVTVGKVKGSVALLPLLHGGLEVSSIEIVKPRITLATDEHGRTNYDFSAPAGGKKAPGGSPSSGPSQLAIDSVSVTDADLAMVEVHGRNVQPPSVKISGFTAEFSNLDLSPTGMSRWKGEIPLSGLKADVSGLPPVHFRSGKLKIDSGDISADCEVELPEVARIKGGFSILNFPKMLSSPSAAHGEMLGNGKFTSDKIRYAPYEFTRFSMDLKVYADRVEAPITLSVYGGTLSINTRLETAPSPSGARRFTANIQLSQLDLEKLAAADPGTRGKLTGHAEAKLQLTGALGNNLMNSLTGPGSFAMRDGKIAGIQGSEALQALSQLGHIIPGTGLPGGGGNLTDATYSSVQGDLSVHGGRIYTNKTEAQTNRGRGDMHGSIGFDETLDLAGHWIFAAGSGGQQQSNNPARAIGGLFGKVAKPTLGELPIPFLVKGTIKNPKVLPG